MGPHQTSRRGPSSRPREQAGKQEGWDGGWGALLRPLSSRFWLSLRQAAQGAVNQRCAPRNLSTALTPSR
ncbi:hypothetical protein CapIbe_017478, partial [Capra ibex]